jgi:AmmeMemoRadiSam system protein B
VASLDHGLQARGLAGLSRVARDREHALEIELPFLQRALQGQFQLLPLMVRTHAPKVLQAVGEALAATLAEYPALLVASTDLSHFFPLKIANLLDETMLDQISRLSPEGVLHAEETGSGLACGAGAVAAVLWAAKALGANAAQVVHHSTSADQTGDESSVVGYGAVVILKRS